MFELSICGSQAPIWDIVHSCAAFPYSPKNFVLIFIYYVYLSSS